MHSCIYTYTHIVHTVQSAVRPSPEHTSSTSQSLDNARASYNAQKTMKIQNFREENTFSATERASVALSMPRLSADREKVPPQRRPTMESGKES